MPWARARRMSIFGCTASLSSFFASVVCVSKALISLFATSNWVRMVRMKSVRLAAKLALAAEAGEAGAGLLAGVAGTLKGCVAAAGLGAWLATLGWAGGGDCTGEAGCEG